MKRDRNHSDPVSRFLLSGTVLGFATFLTGTIIGIQQPVTPFDTVASHLIQALRAPQLNAFAVFITLLGNWQTIVVITAIGSAFLGFKNKRREVTLFLCGIIGSQILYQLLKQLFERSRPDAAAALIAQSGYSLPSGHTLTATVCYGLLAYFGTRNESRTVKVAVFIAAIVLIFGISSSRIYLGVHWPSDVLAGLGLGASLLTTTILLDRKCWRINLTSKEEK